MANWKSKLRDKSVRKAGRGATSSGLFSSEKISLEEVDSIIKAAMDYGGVTVRERKDLELIRKHAKFAGTAARNRFNAFYNIIKAAPAGKRGRRSNTAIAQRAVTEFMNHSGKGVFKGLNRTSVGLGLSLHIANPDVLKQGGTSLCGPTVVMHSLANDNPYAYAMLGIELFEKGRGRFGDIDIKPGSDLKTYALPSKARIDQAHWMLAASMRDSSNWFFDHDKSKNQFSGITLPGAVVSWFNNLGYSKIQSTEVKGRYFKSYDPLNKLIRAGWRVAMLIDADLLYEKSQGSAVTFPNHWVILTTTISGRDDNIGFSVFTWGEGYRPVPQGAKKLSKSDFFSKLFHYVAAKY